MATTAPLIRLEKTVDNSVQNVAVEKVELDHLAVDQLNVTTAPKSHLSLAALTPVLSVLIAALTMLSTSLIQIYQSRNNALQNEDTQWRQALEKIDEKTAAVGAFEMQSFLDGERHKAQARSLSAALMPNIEDKYEFDAAFFPLLTQTTQANQSDIVGIARTLSTQLQSMHDIAVNLKGCKGSPECSLQQFIDQPEAFFSNASQSAQLAQTLSILWRLDSVSSGLSGLWHGAHNRTALTPGSLDLGGIVFLNNDFSNIDFSRATLDEAEFGACPTNHGITPTRIQPGCKPGK